MQEIHQVPNGQALAAQAAQVDDLNREMDSLLYALSHDLRAPLRAIDGFSAALAEDYEASLNDEAQDYLKRIRAAARKLERYLDALLRASRESRGEILPQEVDLSALVRSLAQDLAQKDPDRQVEWDIAPDCLAVTDTTLIRTALAKLMDNAWKFTTKTPQARIAFGPLAQDGPSGFFLSDNGAGLDLAYARDRLFGMFQRLHDDPDLPGLGTGLATAKRIVGRLGGSVRAVGPSGQGARFEIFLPGAGTGEGA